MQSTSWETLGWKGLGAGGEGDDRGWDGWMASLTRWTWVWASPGSWWWTGKPGVQRFMGSQRVRHDWATELTGWLTHFGDLRSTALSEGGSGQFFLPVAEIHIGVCPLHHSWSCRKWGPWAQMDRLVLGQCPCTEHGLQGDSEVSVWPSPQHCDCAAGCPWVSVVTLPPGEQRLTSAS